MSRTFIYGVFVITFGLLSCVNEEITPFDQEQAKRLLTSDTFKVWTLDKKTRVVNDVSIELDTLKENLLWFLHYTHTDSLILAEFWPYQARDSILFDSLFYRLESHQSSDKVDSFKITRIQITDSLHQVIRYDSIVMDSIQITFDTIVNQDTFLFVPSRTVAKAAWSFAEPISGFDYNIDVSLAPGYVTDDSTFTWTIHDLGVNGLDLRYRLQTDSIIEEKYFWR